MALPPPARERLGKNSASHSVLLSDFLTRFGGRGNKQTSYIVSRRVHHIYRSLSRRD